MLVYGDHTFTGHPSPLATRLAQLTMQARATPHDLDQLRALLIFCGQVEQGVWDAVDQAAGNPPPGEARLAAKCAQGATAHAADAFYSLAWTQRVALPRPQVCTAAALDALHTSLAQLAQAPDQVLSIRVPEGFSVYALYPEQYLLAAAQWLAAHRTHRAQGAVVVGIRSIGTTLAAVVRAVLAAAGWQVVTHTVRPTGHPFARQVDLRDLRLEPATLGLIVDEGPGISGSSFAATARALVAAGLGRCNLAFLPSHANEPGGMGDNDVQQWWQSTPRYVAERAALTFDGSPLHTALTATLPASVTQVEDFSDGQWRQRVYPDMDAWPAVCTAFERIKARYTLSAGRGVPGTFPRQVLGKFLGLAAASPALISTAHAAATILRDRSEAGLAPRVLGVAHGFVLTGWIDGQPCAAAQWAAGVRASLARQLGTYIAQVAAPPLDNGDAAAARARLEEMLWVNVCEGMGEAAAAAALRLWAAAPPAPGTYGDGHLHPHEWITAGDHTLHKVDGVGHDTDHTLTGCQPVAWDLAGACVEWGLDQRATQQLMRGYHTARNHTARNHTARNHTARNHTARNHTVCSALVTDAMLCAYQTAYLALRLGQCTLAAQMHAPQERARLTAAAARYRHRLTRLLAVATPAQ